MGAADGKPLDDEDRGILREVGMSLYGARSQIAQRLERVGEIEEAAGVYTQTKIEELAERKFRFDHPELAQPENE